MFSKAEAQQWTDESVKVHPAANLFPMMDDDALNELAEDIRKNGLAQPIWYWTDDTGETVLLDGRNRLEACKRHGIKVSVSWYTGTDPIGFIMSLNLVRRHLTTGQKAAIALELEQLYAIEAHQRKVDAGHKYGEKHPQEVVMNSSQPLGPDTRQVIAKSRDKAAKDVRIGPAAVSQMKRLKNEAPDLFYKVKDGDMSLNAGTKTLKERIHKKEQAEKRRRALSDEGMSEIEAEIAVNGGRMPTKEEIKNYGPKYNTEDIIESEENLKKQFVAENLGKAKKILEEIVAQDIFIAETRSVKLLQEIIDLVAKISAQSIDRIEE